ncbi:hypothetical protein [Raineyella sp.]|uniref:hypothetical protein n=2 Tax=Propionibacteriales TaxID=85009 RepID=UPI002B1F0D59|nr:hypothetical protein [Raineyella sp.]MEA5055308.1 hypothetical protein [Propionicimonas sp.]MEA5155653.1 hypothetical protein [Raineyella sp.]
MTATVAELKRAWRAVEAGLFSDPSTASDRRTADGQTVRWSPPRGERVLPVVGAHGFSGASVLSLALATVAAPARVVECVPLGRCGLVAAPTAELGDYDGLWTRGLRDDVLVERVTGDLRDCDGVPRLSVTDRISGLTVLDVGWDAREVLASDCWLAAALTGAATVVVAATATVAGLRRLETTLGELDRPDASRVVLLGPPRRRWPRGLAATLGPLTRAAERCGWVLSVPLVASLRVGGVDSRPLPADLLTAAEVVLASTRRADSADEREED